MAGARLLLLTDAGARWAPLRAGERQVLVRSGHVVTHDDGHADAGEAGATSLPLARRRYHPAAGDASGLPPGACKPYIAVPHKRRLRHPRSFWESGSPKLVGRGAPYADPPLHGHDSSRVGRRMDRWLWLRRPATGGA